MSSNTEQIKDKLSIVDVISSYVKVEKAGINFKAKCPFHNEKTPSFFISPTRQSFYCFGCGEKGDIFSFVEKFEGLDFKGALQTLADRAGVKLEKFRPEDLLENDRKNEEKNKLFEIMEEAAGFYEKELKTLGFTGERPGSENIADCTVPEDQQDCKMWKKDGSCEKWECPTLADENISSIKIDGDYLVVLEYLPNGANTLIGDFCQAYPKDQDINKFGPKQIKWDSINNSPGIFANYVLIIPIVRN